MASAWAIVSPVLAGAAVGRYGAEATNATLEALEARDLISIRWTRTTIHLVKVQ